MPFMIPFSIKVAIALGTVAGASVAIINNKEIVLETAETIFTKGAEFCRNKLEEAKQKNQQAQFADAYEDDHFKQYEEDSHKSNLNGESDYEGISTPEASDFSEIETDDYMDSDDDEKEANLKNRRTYHNDEKLETQSLD
ncbi:unnamed protein product [Candida verbasci]|uniref:Uncharacterized protein n=1 Tax=Candida verbasci TaxID=1227364 RepID=A0A9W4TXI9_9ASCO|nr:unnamed protein product [Candida verbasci]